MKNIFYIFILLVGATWATSCREFLDQKSDLRLSTPESLADNQALLDRLDNLRDYAVSGELSTTDLFLTDQQVSAWNHDGYKRLYVWEPDYVSRSFSQGNDWSGTYNAIFTANTVLQSLDEYNLVGTEADNIRGQALVLRAARYLDAAQIWCKAYDPVTASDDLGLPLRMNPDFNTPTVRHSIAETYDAILKDLKEALPLLPAKESIPTRITKASAHGLLARTYLFMGDYENSLKHSLETLALSPQLMDFNSLDLSLDAPIPELNVELIFHAWQRYEQEVVFARIPQNIYDLYGDDDLRKSVYFTHNQANEILFRGTYNGYGTVVTGIVTDEVYLMAAESYARLGQVNDAMGMLNILLKSRWKANTFIPLKATSPEGALEIILSERKKELLIRGLNWADIKRYNRDGAGISLVRSVNGVDYQLPANDLRFSIAIPEEVISRTGIPQNPR